MYFEVILNIFLSLFAVFGVYCIICIISQTFMRSDNISVAVFLWDEDDFFDLDIHLEDASSLCFLRNTARRTVLVERKLSEDPRILEVLIDKGIDFVIFDGKEK